LRKFAAIRSHFVVEFQSDSIEESEQRKWIKKTMNLLAKCTIRIPVVVPSTQLRLIHVLFAFQTASSTTTSTMTTPAKLYGKDLSEYDDIDVDTLLAQLSAEEITILAKEVDPDVS
jgi:Tropomodulin